MSAEDRVNLNGKHLCSSFAYGMSDDTVYCIDCATFNLWKNKGPQLVLSKWDKKVTTTFHKNQRLNIANQYHKDATQVAPGIIQTSEEPHNITPNQIHGTLKERQMKYPKIVEALDRILCLQEFCYQETQERAAKSDIL